MAHLFFCRLVPHRPDFAATMTPAEAAVMGEHGAFLRQQLASGKLVVAGPVLDPAGAFGMAVYEGASLDEVRALVARDPANAVGRYELLPLGGGVFRPALGPPPARPG